MSGQIKLIGAYENNRGGGRILVLVEVDAGGVKNN